jgi:diguanylate cyclase (GGDEF)-like protein/PAS domain S-box-containing protein
MMVRAPYGVINDRDFPATPGMKPVLFRCARSIAGKARSMYGDYLPCAVCGTLPLSGDELRIERELALTALAAVADGVIRGDAAGRVRFCNEAALRLLGCAADTVLDQPFDQVVQFESGLESGPESGLGPMQQLLRGGAVDSMPLHGRLRTAGGRLLPVEGLLRPVRDGAGALIGCILVLRDLSQTQALARQLLHQASHDPLTGLPNRNRFEEQLTAMLAAARGSGEVHAMLHLDLDRFTVINDTCGHREADRLLQLVARELLSRLRSDDILARIGDDKFGVILNGCGPEPAMLKAAALVEAIERARFQVGGRSFHLTLSAGVTGIDRNVADARQLLIQADTACYVAKRLGGNRAQLYRSGDHEVSRTRNDMEWVARIEHALDENRIELHAQRIVPLDGGSAPCYELLVRLRLPDGSVAMPGAFLPAAQHFGLMDRIERCVVRQALDQLERLQSSAEFGYLSINLSGNSLSDGGFTAFVLRELEQRATPPERVRFEITETAALGETAAAREFIAAMHRRGYKILLDDFGTGFTSFGYLKSLGANGLKVDQSFTRNLADDVVNQTIVESICKIGSRLGLEIIAEGVEDEVTLQALRSLGVRHAQGWLFHRPEPLEKVLS